MVSTHVDALKLSRDIRNVVAQSQVMLTKIVFAVLTGHYKVAVTGDRATPLDKEDSLPRDAVNPDD